jgi:hypothetical protein
MQKWLNVLFLVLLASNAYAQKLIIRTSDGLLEYSGSEVQSLSFQNEDAVVSTQLEAKQLAWSLEGSNTLLQLSLAPEQNYRIVLLDVSGKTIQQYSGNTGTQSIAQIVLPANLATGIYFLKVETGRKLGSWRFRYSGNYKTSSLDYASQAMDRK